MRILCLSDLHGVLPPVKGLPKADLALIAGDLPPLGATSQHQYTDMQAAWVRQDLAPWVNDLAARMPVIAIAGNHDFVATYPWGERLLRSLAWTYLRDQSVTVNGLSIFGSPWTPTHPDYPDWAFQRPDDQLARHWLKIPRSTDILLVHGPPHGVRDEVDEGVHAGSATLTAWLDRTRELTGTAPLVVCGHLHEHPGYDADALVAVSSITRQAGEAPRGQVLVLEGEPGAWSARMVKTPMDRTSQWLANHTPAEHTRILHQERL